MYHYPLHLERAKLAAAPRLLNLLPPPSAFTARCRLREVLAVDRALPRVGNADPVVRAYAAAHDMAYAEALHDVLWLASCPGIVAEELLLYAGLPWGLGSLNLYHAQRIINLVSTNTRRHV